MPTDFEVVVVSSDLKTRRHLADILTRLALDAICVRTLRECRAVLAQRPVGLIFCDPHVSDGTYQDLLTGGPDGKPRVVVTSRLADWQEFADAKEAGAFDLITSPPRPADVEWMVIQAKRQRHKNEAPTVMRSQAAKAAAGPAEIPR